MHRAGLVFIAFFVLVLPSLAQQLTGPKQVLATRLPLWKIEGKKCSVYLLASIHCLKKEHYPLPRPIEEAFERAKIAVFERDLAFDEDPSKTNIMAKAHLPRGETLASHLSPEVHGRLVEYLGGSNVVLEGVQGFRPGVVAMFLEFWELQNMGFDIKLGIDSYFNERANKEGKQVIGLESQLFHTELLAGLTKDEAEALLNNVLKNLGKFRANVEKISTAWQAGEMTVVADYINREIGDHPTLIHRLLVERNKNWVPQIEALAKGDKDAIVTVGAGHLAGKQSLVELLEKNGWKVTQQVMLPNEERAKPAL